MSFYNEYAVIPTRTPNNEQYYTLNQIPKPKYLGFEGDSCSSELDCHEKLMCIQNKCGKYIPNISVQRESRGGVTQPIKEKFQSVPGVDFYKLSPDYDDFPYTTRPSINLEYTSKYKSKSGRNYW